MASAVTKKTFFGACPRTERGNGTYITADVAHDRFAYCSTDHIVIRKISNPHDAEVYRGHQEPTCIRFSPNGAYAATGDAHGMVKVWNTANPGIMQLEQQVLSGAIRDISWTPDDQRILVCGEGRSEVAIMVLVSGGSRVGSITGFTQGCLSCDLKPSRPFKMVVVSNDRHTAFWKGPPLKAEWNKEEMDILAKQVRYSPDGAHFIAVGSGKGIVYNGTSGERAYELPVEHKGTTTGVSWSGDSKHVITSNCDHTVKMWNIENATCVKTFTFGDDDKDMGFQQLGCAWLGEQIVSVSLNGDLCLLNPETDDAPTSVVTGLMGKVEGLAIVGSTVYGAGTADGNVKLVSFEEGVGSIARVVGDGPKQSVTGMVSCGTDVLTLSMDGCLNIANAEVAAGAAFSAKIADLQIPTKDLACGADLVVCASQGSLTTHRKSSGYTVLSKLEGMDYAPLQVAVSPDESVVAVSAQEVVRQPKKIVLYNVEGDTLVPFKEITGHQKAVFALAFSPDGKYLAAGDGNREVRVYDCANDYECLREDLQYNAGRITCLAWHPDSDMVVSGDIAKKLVVTHINKILKPTLADNMSSSPMTALSFVNHETLAVGDTSGTVHLVNFKKME